MRAPILYLLTLALLLCGCNAKKTIVPLDPDVIPVTTPTLYRYGPAQGKIKLTAEAVNPAKGEQTYTSIIFEYEGSEKEGIFIWTSRLIEIEENGKKVAPGLPIAEIISRSDSMGNSELVSIHSPWKLSLPDGERLEKELIEQMHLETNELLWPLPEEPIVTGELLTEFGGAHISTGSSGRNQTKIKMILEGEKVVNGVTYVTAQLDEKMSQVVQGRRVVLQMKGHMMLNKATMIVQNMYVALTFTSGGENIGAIKMSMNSIE